jgi:RHS repeat-associated protein
VKRRAGFDSNDGFFAYDNLGRLVTATSGNTQALSFVYDALGRLTSLTSGGTTTTFLYDGDALVAEYEGSTLLRRHVHWPGADVPVATWEGAGLTDPRYLHADERGSIVAITDLAGAATLNRYDEYGVPGTGNAGRFGYTGQLWLPQLGLYYYKARMYSPYGGRFMQADPVGYQGGINLYGYVEDDPANGSDPTGAETNEYASCGSRINGANRCSGISGAEFGEFMRLGGESGRGPWAYGGGGSGAEPARGMGDNWRPRSPKGIPRIGADILRGQEGRPHGGHRLRFHVDKTNAFLRGRIINQRLTQASTFSSEMMAHAALIAGVEQDASYLNAWLISEAPRVMFTFYVPYPNWARKE